MQQQWIKFNLSLSLKARFFPYYYLKLTKFNVVHICFSELILEKAYCQYRMNQVQDALKTVNTVENLTFQLKELKAQILYRLER